MIKELQVSLSDLVMSLTGVIDMMEQPLVDHHKQVAYIAAGIGAELGIPLDQQRELALAGLVHDIGAISPGEHVAVLQFDIVNPGRHAAVGYALLREFQPLANAASLVRFHHTPWHGGAGEEFQGQPVPVSAHILHLADRVAVLIDKRHEVLGQVKGICERIVGQSGKKFAPDQVDAFMSLASKEYFWLDAASPSLGSISQGSARLPTIVLDVDGLLSFASLCSHIIDFRSPFTATHSSGVAASAVSLARLAGFSERECRMMLVAGYLHDLGKLIVPTDILEKPAKLTDGELNIMRRHTFYTYRTLDAITGMETINEWASFHHERLDGRGYPFHHKGKDLSLGARIMAVADVFSAVTEDRPYRKGMSNDRAQKLIERMADDSALDADIASLLVRHFDEVVSIRMDAQRAASPKYQELRQVHS